MRALTLSTELKTKISLNADEGSYLGSILDQLEGIIENPKNIKHMASQIPKTIERVHDDLKENHPRATAIVLQVKKPQIARFRPLKYLGSKRFYNHKKSENL